MPFSFGPVLIDLIILVSTIFILTPDSLPVPHHPHQPLGYRDVGGKQRISRQFVRTYPPVIVVDAGTYLPARYFRKVVPAVVSDPAGTHTCFRRKPLYPCLYAELLKSSLFRHSSAVSFSSSFPREFPSRPCSQRRLLAMNTLPSPSRMIAAVTSFTFFIHLPLPSRVTALIFSAWSDTLSSVVTMLV